MPTQTASDVRALVQTDLPDLISIRHDLHRYPEIMFQESRTSELVQKQLTELGIPFKAGLAGGTGVVAHLPATNGAGDTVALRADMDALPINEETGKAYASENPGVMHACGHDGHTTILLGAARALSKVEHRPNGVTFVFQPAEEGGAGGQKMCEDGALLGDAGGGVGSPVTRIFGLHGWPQMPLGTVATRPGPLLASTDEIEITIRGVQAHAAYPHLGRDPIVAASALVVALQSIASRTVSPLDSVVVTIGMMHAGSAKNVIPETARLEGTIRTLRAETRTEAVHRVKLIADQVATAYGCRAEVNLQQGYPVTSNDSKLVEHFYDVARETVGDDRVGHVEEPSMGGEDFSFYGHHVPACFYLLGLLPDGQDPMGVAQLHQPTFDFNDNAIATGVEMMCKLALATR